MARVLPVFSFFLCLSFAGISFAADAPKIAPDPSAGALRPGMGAPAETGTHSRFPGTDQEVDPTDVSPAPSPSSKPAVSPNGKGRDEIQLDPGEILGRSNRQFISGFKSISTSERLLSFSQPTLALAKPAKRPPPPVEVDPNAVLGQSAKPLGQGFESSAINEGDPSCTSGQMPFHLLRSIVFFVQSKDGMACSAAVRSIRSLKDTYGPDAYETLKTPSYLSNPNHILARRIVESYVDECSKGLQEGAVSKLLTLDNQIRVAKSVGIITTPTQRCMGAIVGSRVLTARHCFAIPEADAGVHQLIPAESAVDFDTLSGDHFSLSFDGSDRSPLREDQRDKDWITLAMNPLITAGPSMSLGYDPELAQVWQPLVLISMSPYVMALRNDFRSSTSNAVIDISPVCDILAKDGGYIFHACQTLAGMSGAPLLTMKDGLLTVVGIHTGDTQNVQTPCAQSIARRYVNYGVVPPADLGDAK
jgi:hypothetical protein